LPTRSPYDRPEAIYERNGVTIGCFPAIHGLSGAVGYTVSYGGQKVAFSGDTQAGAKQRC
jgi:ribonuclease BN (tRNA processing enzyme)